MKALINWFTKIEYGVLSLWVFGAVMTILSKVDGIVWVMTFILGTIVFVLVNAFEHHKQGKFND